MTLKNKLIEKTPISWLEKWLNRLITLALAAAQLIEYIATHWQLKP